MAGITNLALKKINLIFPGQHELYEREFVKRFIIEPLPALIYKPGLDSQQLLEFSSRCDLYGIYVIGFEFKDLEMIPIESHSYEEYCEEYNWGWVRLALLKNQHTSYGTMLFPIVDVTDKIIRDYLCS
jgi:hypothetical protein